MKYLFLHSKIPFAFYIILLLSIETSSQNPIRFTFQNSAFISTDSVQPFWFVANQHGKIISKGAFLNLSEIEAEQFYKSTPVSGVGYTWGGNLLLSVGNSGYWQLNRAFFGLAFKGWELKGGKFYDETQYAGLSTTNGNIARSQNARPVPMIRLSTLDFKSLPFAKNWLSYKGEFDEGLLNDNRYVKGTHLHHKSLYFRIQPSKLWYFKGGLEHYVMWGGTSKDNYFGNLAETWNAYWHYIFAIPGGRDFPNLDQENISGNQLGTYQFEFVKYFSLIKASFYISHPWEDNSGLNLHNRLDNLLGLHLSFNKKNAFLTDVVYEYTNTTNQSYRDSSKLWDENSKSWKKLEIDDYYNHVIYRSGFTYHRVALSSSLFFPVAENNGMSMGIQSNRFYSHHFGAKGNLSENISWKGLLTYIKRFGTYAKPYKPAQKQLSGLFEVQYFNPKFPFEIGLAAGGDITDYKGINSGIKLFLTRSW